MSQQKGVFNQPRYAAALNGISKAEESIFHYHSSTEAAGYTSDYHGMKSQEQGADLALGFVSSLLHTARVGCGFGAWDAVPAPVWQI